MRDQVYTPELITAAIGGDDSALNFLYNSTQDKVTQTVRSMIRDEDAVLDIVQDSFIKGFRSLDKLDDPKNFLAWMRRIATNTAVDYLKKKKPVLFSELAGEDGMEIEFEDENIGHMPDVLLDQKETSRLIQEIVSGLSDEQQLAIGLFYFEDMSIKSIAEKLGCSENTVKSRLNYGRKNIEKQVLELEKKGTKLYSLAPVPFFLWLLRSMHTEPSRDMLGAVLAECRCLASGVSATASQTAVQVGSQVAKKTSGSVAKKLATRIAASVLAVATVCVAAVVIVSGGDGISFGKSDSQETAATMQMVPVCEDDAHVWADAPCEVARTCTKCGVTEDAPRGHDWADADYQVPKTCRTCNTTEGKPLTAGFLVQGLDARLLDKGETYDFTLPCYLDKTKYTTGKLWIDSYSVFTSDDTHEAMEGYEWRVLVLKVRFDDKNAQKYGAGTFRYLSTDYYEAGKATPLGENGANTFDVSWYGVVYPECYNQKSYVVEDWQQYDNGEYYLDLVVTYAYRVPMGYDGCVVGISDAAMEWPIGAHLYEVIDETARLFRLD